MRRQFLLFILLTFVSASHAQIDIEDFGAMQLGVVFDHTNMTGAYILRDAVTGKYQSNIADEFSSVGMELRGIRSNENGIEMVNYEGLIYLLNRIAFHDPDATYAYNTPMDKFFSDYSSVMSCPAVPDDAKLANIHVADMVGARPFGSKGWLGGIQGSLRTIGLAHNLTKFPTAVANQEAFNTISNDYKILFGLNLGYRKNITSLGGLIVMAGVNTGLNTKDHLNTTDKFTRLQVRANPWVNAQFFFGKRAGGYAGIYWEKMYCKDNYTAFLMMDGDKPIRTGISESQLQIKLGFYFPLRNNQ